MFFLPLCAICLLLFHVTCVITSLGPVHEIALRNFAVFNSCDHFTFITKTRQPALISRDIAWSNYHLVVNYYKPQRRTGNYRSFKIIDNGSLPAGPLSIRIRRCAEMEIRKLHRTEPILASLTSYCSTHVQGTAPCRVSRTQGDLT